MQDLADGYSDVSGDAWYADGIAWAVENGNLVLLTSGALHKVFQHLRRLGTGGRSSGGELAIGVAAEDAVLHGPDISSLEHTSWRCQYHIVFAPKYRRMEIYGQIKQDIGVILRKLCQQKGVATDKSPLRGPERSADRISFTGHPLRGIYLCLLILATRKRVNKFFVQIISICW